MGGIQPRWRSDGNELFYYALDGRFMAATINTNTPLRVTEVRPLFPLITVRSNLRSFYSVSADGQRFLINAMPAEMWTGPLTVVLNWQAALEK